MRKTWPKETDRYSVDKPFSTFGEDKPSLRLAEAASSRDSQGTVDSKTDRGRPENRETLSGATIVELRDRTIDSQTADQTVDPLMTTQNVDPLMATYVTDQITHAAYETSKPN